MPSASAGSYLRLSRTTSSFPSPSTSAIFTASSLSESCRLSGSHPPVPLREIDQCLPCTASTSVTPSPVKSPKCSALSGNEELFRFRQPRVIGENTDHWPVEARRKMSIPFPPLNRPTASSESGMPYVPRDFHGCVPPLEITHSFPCTANTSQRPSPSKSPSFTSFNCSGAAFRYVHCMRPARDIHQVAPVARKRSSSPSPSKSQTPYLPKKSKPAVFDAVRASSPVWVLGYTFSSVCSSTA